MSVLTWHQAVFLCPHLEDCWSLLHRGKRKANAGVFFCTCLHSDCQHRHSGYKVRTFVVKWGHLTGPPSLTGLDLRSCVIFQPFIQAWVARAAASAGGPRLSSPQQLLLANLTTFPGPPRDLISPVCLRSSPEAPLPVGQAQNASPGSQNHFNWLLSLQLFELVLFFFLVEVKMGSVNVLSHPGHRILLFTLRLVNRISS